MRTACEQILGEPVESVRSVHGGDINEALMLQTRSRAFFLKFNSAPMALAMFGAEAKGLHTIAATGAVRVPHVWAYRKTAHTAFLLLEFIPAQKPSPFFWENLGRALAALHRNTQKGFGLDYDNFIGTLSQSNSIHDTFTSFYVTQRLQPQVRLAIDKDRLPANELSKWEFLFHHLDQWIPSEPPALIHGDLWHGNFMTGQDDIPVLIDPSVSFSHRELDLAMSRLFGGFDPLFYLQYDDAFPLAPGWEERLPLFQLYYLLVHVNLFGGGYIGQVRRILNQFAP